MDHVATVVVIRRKDVHVVAVAVIRGLQREGGRGEQQGRMMGHTMGAQHSKLEKQVSSIEIFNSCCNHTCVT